MMTKDATARAAILLEEPKKIVITTHRNPDGDAIGSSLGLYHFLLKLGHSPVVISPNDLPDFLEWMPGSETIRVFEKDNEACTAIIKEAALIFTLDFNTFGRVGDTMAPVLQQATAPFIMIDHHQQPDSYPAVMFSDTGYGSTCEMVYHFIVALGKGNLIDKSIAECLYTGIVTDSGSFRYPLTTGTTHRVVARFIDLGIDNSTIHSQLFDNHSHNRMQLLARALQNMKVLPEYKTSYTYLSQAELDNLGFKKGDTEGIVNYGLGMKGIIFTAFFIEYKDEGIVKISFRSKGGFDVNAYARKYFNGGGHINASGGKSTDSLEDTIQKFIATLAATKLKDV